MDPFTIASLALSGASLVQGAVRGAQAKKLGKKYDQFEAGIPMQDPGEVQRLADVRRRRAAFDAGNDPLTGYVSQQARNFGSQTQANLVRAGAQPNDLLRSNAGTANAIAGAGARAAQRGDAAFAMEGDLISSMATRAYNRQLSRAQRIWTEYQAKKQGSNQAIQAGLGMLPNIAFQGGARGGAKSNDPAQFDPFAATSEGVGTYYPGAYNAGDLADPQMMDTIGGVASPLSYVPRG